MSQYSITKIIDGLFISDSLVPMDVAFLRGNKIICTLGWTAQPQLHFTEDDDIREVLLSKNTAQIKFPSYDQLQEGFRQLEFAHEEMLCGLIYSESELEAALIGIMYLMFRYRWDCNTAFAFVRNKMEAFEFSDQAIEGLELFETQLKEHSHDLAHILWDYDFLVNYRPVFDEEALLINTIRNKLRQHQPLEFTKPSSKVQRVRWQDQIRPSSALKISSSKNIRRSSINKNKPSLLGQEQQGNGSSADLELLYQSVGYRSPPSLGLKSAPCRKDKESVGEDDFQFLQLKEMSRTNFNDRKYMGSKMRRKGSLKPSRPQKTQSSINLHSISALVGIYSNNPRPTSGKSSALTRSGSAGQPFWNSLRNYNKISLVNA